MVLSLLMALLVSSGDRTAPRVRDFSWQNKRVGAEDSSFVITFSRPMDRATVEANLQIQPILPGKISWAGRRMAYTLTEPPAYGTKYNVELKNAKDRFSSKNNEGAIIQPFAAQFQTRDRAFVYQGIQGEELGKLILYNFTQNQKTILTPPNLTVMDFKPYPDSEKVLFSAATNVAASKNQGFPPQELYTVTTGLNASEDSNKSSQPAGIIERVLDSKDYQNLKFDLSTDGETIVIQRVNHQNPSEFGLWIVRQNEGQETPTIQKMDTQPGGDFLITPDSSAVAIAQGQGVAILPLPNLGNTQANTKVKPLDFLPKFGMVLDFSKDGSTAAMVKFNTDYTRSLFFVNNQGIQKEILQTKGSILSCKFHPSSILYCLLTQLIPGEVYQEQPYLAEIDLKTAQLKPLLVLPNQRDIQMSLSPDGLALLFDQVVSSVTPGEGLRTNEGQAISTSRLWLLPLVTPDPTSTKQIQPEQLPLPGLHPRWLP